MFYIFYYILLGLIISIFLEIMIVNTGNEINEKERLSMILLWPIMILIFIIYFLASIFEDDNPPY